MEPADAIRLAANFCQQAARAAATERNRAEDALALAATAAGPDFLSSEANRAAVAAYQATGLVAPAKKDAAEAAALFKALPRPRPKPLQAAVKQAESYAKATARDGNAAAEAAAEAAALLNGASGTTPTPIGPEVRL